MKFDTQDLCGAKTERGYNMTCASGLPFWPADPRPGDVRIEDIAAHLSRICRFNGALKATVEIVTDVEVEGSTGYSLIRHEVAEIYSVAQHSVLVCDHLNSPRNSALGTLAERSTSLEKYARELKLAALLHDAVEYVCQDRTKPNKCADDAFYAAVSAQIGASRMAKIERTTPSIRERERRTAHAIEKRFSLPSGILDHPLIKEQDYRAVLTEHRDLQEQTGAVDWGLDRAKAEPWPERIVPLLPSAAAALFLQRFNELYKGE